MKSTRTEEDGVEMFSSPCSFVWEEPDEANSESENDSADDEQVKKEMQGDATPR